MDLIIKYFTELPDTSKAAIIASLITFIGVVIAATAAFIGVYVTHCGHEKRFGRQLEHDKEVKRIEREMSLRKEIFLGAAEAIVAGLGAVTRYADLKVPHDELAKEFIEKRSAIAKVHIIAREETIYAVSAFMDELSATLIRLSLLRQPLTQMQNRLKSLDNQIQISGKEKDRLVELMKQLNFEGNTEQHRWNFVKNTFEFEDNRIKEATQEHQSLALKLKSEHLTFLVTCYESSTQVSKLLIPAVREVRSELELPFDESRYSQMIENSGNQQTQLIKEFIARLRG